jgi:hypothetical protein
MTSHFNQLVQIANYIQRADTNNVTGLARLDYITALESVQKLSTDLTGCMLDLESIGQQPHEVFNFGHTVDIQIHILAM